MQWIIWEISIKNDAVYLCRISLNLLWVSELFFNCFLFNFRMLVNQRLSYTFSWPLQADIKYFDDLWVNYCIIRVLTYYFISFISVSECGQLMFFFFFWAVCVKLDLKFMLRILSNYEVGIELRIAIINSIIN